MEKRPHLNYVGPLLAENIMHSVRALHGINSIGLSNNTLLFCNNIMRSAQQIQCFQPSQATFL